ncbi:tigger transposable element-derived protein 1 [Trichonephila clavipes]|nr:tigger transposable element-derived protein 1 [Trichonephila clavipes]
MFDGLIESMFDGLVAFAVDRWRHDCGARRVRVISRPGHQCRREGSFWVPSVPNVRMKCKYANHHAKTIAFAGYFVWPNGEKKHQRQSISLETKIAFLDRLGKGEGSTAIGKHFNLGESTVRAIKKNEAAIRKSVISGTKLSTKFASYTRDVLIERTERAIAIWIEEQVQRRIPVSGCLIQGKALQFYKSMKQSEPSTSTSQAGKEFSASKGWLTGFLKRNALHNIKITGESATVEQGAVKIFPEELAKIIEDGDYSADQVFNADETGLYWKKLPNRTYIAKDEKTASGHKASKDRVSLLLCSNASGDRMLKPLLINKSLRPCALKGKDFKQLPVHWMANPKAWMTTAIFTEWFNNCFVPEVEAYMKEKSLDFKVLLIVDNAASHLQLEHPNVQLVFLPPNTTSLIQPLDQGIIATFKKYYIKTSHDDIDELLVDDALSDNDIIDLTLDLTVDGVVGLEGDNNEEEKSTPLTGKLIQEGLQLCSNSERASKLQRRATQNENEVCENPWPLPQISIAETVSSDEVNGDRYRAMITNFFIPELNNHDVQELWFQQDGTTCHTARATIDLLKDTFGDRLISRRTCELASKIL